MFWDKKGSNTNEMQIKYSRDKAFKFPSDGGSVPVSWLFPRSLFAMMSPYVIFDKK